MSIEIIGGNLENAFVELEIIAEKTYESKENEFGSKIQVWSLTEEEYKKLTKVDDANWKSEYGWWRNGGCNYGVHELTTFIINDNEMIGFKNDHSTYQSMNDESEELDFLDYPSFSDWFYEYMNLSKPENLAYFANSLAKYNDLSITDFFKKFEG